MTGESEIANKKAPGPVERSRGLVCMLKKLSRESGGYSVLGPATCRGAGKRPGPPPATVKEQAVLTRVGPNQWSPSPVQQTQGKKIL